MQGHQRLVAGGAVHHLICNQALWFRIFENNKAGKFVMPAQRAYQAEANADQRQALAASTYYSACRYVAARAGARHCASVKKVYTDGLFSPVNRERINELISARLANPPFARHDLTAMA